jgi:hypothetical protein
MPSAHAAPKLGTTATKENAMSVDTKGFRTKHERLSEHSELRAVSDRFPELDPDGRETALREVMAYLRDEVEPHTRLDEWLLYPAIAKRVGDPLVAASMNYDHVAIRRWISELGAADSADVAEVQRLLYGLDALIRVHIWKENELFLRPLESASWPAAG